MDISSVVWRDIVLYIKFPEYIGSWFVGFSLGIVGCIMQGLLRNPLADPGILGVSSGASFFGVLVICFLPAMGGLSSGVITLTFIFASFIGATLVLVLLYLFTKVIYNTSPVTVILVGVALSGLFNALSMLLVTFSQDEQMRQAIVWGAGGVTDVSWSSVLILLIALSFSLIFLFRCVSSLNILSLGEDSAKSAGLDVTSLLLRIVIGTSIIIATSIALFGPLGFIGLIAPHISRMMRGPEHRKLLITSGLVGGVIMMLTTYVSYEVAYPYVISKGIIIAILGGPFFLWLLFQNYSTKRN
jgi:iron complex transport system permease protein